MDILSLNSQLIKTVIITAGSEHNNYIKKQIDLIFKIKISENLIKPE